MKIIITTILILLSLSVSSQSLMLSVPRSRVKQEMKAYIEFEKVYEDKNYIEYQDGDRFVAYYFQDRICTEATITMPYDLARSFVEEKESCNCWSSVGDDEWLYQTSVFDALVVVKRYWGDESVTFSYTF